MWTAGLLLPPGEWFEFTPVIANLSFIEHLYRVVLGRGQIFDIVYFLVTLLQ